LAREDCGLRSNPSLAPLSPSNTPDPTFRNDVLREISLKKG
jgi:hypothetical protein